MLVSLLLAARSMAQAVRIKEASSGEIELSIDRRSERFGVGADTSAEQSFSSKRALVSEDI